MIGRSKVCKTVVTHGRVSGQHAVFFRHDGAGAVGTARGTFLNGELLGKGASAPVRAAIALGCWAPPAEGIVFRLELGPTPRGHPPPSTPDTPAGAPPVPVRGSSNLADSPDALVQWGGGRLPPGVRRHGSAASVASSEAPTEWPTEVDPAEARPAAGSLLGPSRVPPAGAPPSQYVMMAPQPVPSQYLPAQAAAAVPVPPYHMPQVAPQQLPAAYPPPPSMHPPPSSVSGYGASNAQMGGGATSRPPPIARRPCAHGLEARRRRQPSLVGPDRAPSRHARWRRRWGRCPSSGSATHGGETGGGIITGVGAPNANRDISRDEPWLRLQQLQVEALNEVAASDLSALKRFGRERRNPRRRRKRHPQRQ